MSVHPDYLITPSPHCAQVGALWSSWVTGSTGCQVGHDSGSGTCNEKRLHYNHCLRLYGRREKHGLPEQKNRLKKGMWSLSQFFSLKSKPCAIFSTISCVGLQTCPSHRCCAYYSVIIFSPSALTMTSTIVQSVQKSRINTGSGCSPMGLASRSQLAAPCLASCSRS